MCDIDYFANGDSIVTPNSTNCIPFIPVPIIGEWKHVKNNIYCCSQCKKEYLGVIDGDGTIRTITTIKHCPNCGSQNLKG